MKQHLILSIILFSNTLSRTLLSVRAKGHQRKNWQSERRRKVPYSARTEAATNYGYSSARQGETNSSVAPANSGVPRPETPLTNVRLRQTSGAHMTGPAAVPRDAATGKRPPRRGEGDLQRAFGSSLARNPVPTWRTARSSLRQRRTTRSADRISAATPARMTTRRGSTHHVSRRCGDQRPSSALSGVARTTQAVGSVSKSID
jgi:hypothetical protein